LLGLTTFKSDRISGVFDVDIVGPLESEKTAAPKILPPPVTKHAPFVQKPRPKPVDEKPAPDTFYGEGEETSPKSDNAKSGPGSAARNEQRVSIAEDSVIKPPDEKKPETLPVVPPSALFDKKTIEKFALKEHLPDRKFTFDMPELKNRSYRKMMKDKIEYIWDRQEEFLKIVSRHGLSSGDLYITFSIKKDGTIGKVELDRTSGYKEIDGFIMKMLKGITLWPLPDDVEADEVDVPAYFYFGYGSSYMM